MNNSINSCFISAPYGFDLTIFKRVLCNNNIATIYLDTVNLEIENSFIEAIEQAIKRSDFICAIIPYNQNYSNIFFEIGLAFALNKPIIIFIGKTVNMPIEMKNITTFISNFENESSIQFNIESFLKYGVNKNELINNDNHSSDQVINKASSEYVSHLIHPTKNLKVKSETGFSQYNIISDIDLDKIEINLNISNEIQFERSIVEIFKKSGYLTESQHINKDHHFDIALWIDKLERFFGNPILVEVKFGNLSKKSLKECEINLRKQLKNKGVNLGLIIYNDYTGQNYPDLSKDLPLIIKFGYNELMYLLKTNQFESEIISKRNKIAHRSI